MLAEDYGDFLAGECKPFIFSVLILFDLNFSAKVPLGFNIDFAGC